MHTQVKRSRLSEFVCHKEAERAALSRAHVLALRLYSSPVSRLINSALHDGCSAERPHPYPALVITLVEALSKLRGAQAHLRQAALLKARQLAEAARKVKDDPDSLDAEISKANLVASNAAAASERLQCSTWWRGVHGLPYDEFKARGGVEAGFMSMSSERTVASQDAIVCYTAQQRAQRQAEAEAQAQAATVVQVAQVVPTLPAGVHCQPSPGANRNTVCGAAATVMPSGGSSAATEQQHTRTTAPPPA